LSHPDVHLLRKTSQEMRGLDGAFLKHKGADNIMLILVSRNDNLENIIVAVAICPTEDEDNCVRFMDCCIAAGTGLSSQPDFSDRGSGVIEAAEVRDINLHYCTRYVLGNMKSKFKGQVTVCVERWLWDIQGVDSELEFEVKVSAFAIGFPDIVDYIRKIDPARWAMYPHAQSNKLYGWRTTNFVESENAKALHPRWRNPTLFFQFFMEKWMNTKFKRYTEVKKWIPASKRVTPKARELMEEQAANARFHDISLSNVDVDFVRDMRGSPQVRRRVNLREKSCTCSFYIQYGILVAHICSMLAFIKQPERVFEFFDGCYLVNTYMEANDASTTNIPILSWSSRMRPRHQLKCKLRY
jgi:thiol-disulfide isomerase/thioredoxin